jgi:hypothetical protein
LPEGRHATHLDASAPPFLSTFISPWPLTGEGESERSVVGGSGEEVPFDCEDKEKVEDAMELFMACFDADTQYRSIWPEKSIALRRGKGGGLSVSPVC